MILRGNLPDSSCLQYLAKGESPPEKNKFEITNIITNIFVLI